MVCIIIIKLAFTMLPVLDNHVQISVNGMKNGFLTYIVQDLSGIHNKLKGMNNGYKTFQSADGHIHTLCKDTVHNPSRILKVIEKLLSLEKASDGTQNLATYEKTAMKSCVDTIKKNRNVTLKISDLIWKSQCRQVDIVDAIRKRWIKLHGKYTCLNGENFDIPIYEADIPIYMYNVLDSFIAIQLWKKSDEKLILVYSRGNVHLVKKIGRSSVTYHMISSYNSDHLIRRTKDAIRLYESVEKNRARLIPLTIEGIFGPDIKSGTPYVS